MSELKSQNEENSDDEPVLSSSTLAALQEFYTEQKIHEDIEKTDHNSGANIQPQEDWELSQFWYSENTTNALAKETLAVIGSSGRVACLCCPTLYIRLISDLSPTQLILFEFDVRFSHYPNFVAYDYRQPEQLPSDLHHSFDLIVLDPPFLSEECLTRCTETVRLLGKPNMKIILCTGSVQAELASRLLSLKECLKFIPQHTRNLSNPFACFVNYPTVCLDKTPT